MRSFKQYLTEMNIPGYHLDGNTGDGRGALLPSSATGSEQADGGGRLPFLPSLDMAMNSVEQKIPKVMDSIKVTDANDNDPKVPIHPSLEYVAKISPKAYYQGTVTYTNGVPTESQIKSAEAPKNHIYVTLKEQNGKSVNVIMTRPQYEVFKNMNGGKDVALGMNIAVCMQRLINDQRLNLPWGKNKYKTTPNLSNILGVKYWR